MDDDMTTTESVTGLWSRVIVVISLSTLEHIIVGELLATVVL
jgi:hypothetical protein